MKKIQIYTSKNKPPSNWGTRKQAAQYMYIESKNQAARKNNSSLI